MKSMPRFAQAPSRVIKASPNEARDLMIHSLVNMVQSARPETDRLAQLPQLLHEH